MDADRLLEALINYFDQLEHTGYLSNQLVLDLVVADFFEELEDDLDSVYFLEFDEGEQLRKIGKINECLNKRLCV